MKLIHYLLSDMNYQTYTSMPLRTSLQNTCRAFGSSFLFTFKTFMAIGLMSYTSMSSTCASPQNTSSAFGSLLLIISCTLPLMSYTSKPLRALRQNTGKAFGSLFLIISYTINAIRLCLIYVNTYLCFAPKYLLGFGSLFLINNHSLHPYGDYTLCLIRRCLDSR